jgi:hypothetical protein
LVTVSAPEPSGIDVPVDFASSVSNVAATAADTPKATSIEAASLVLPIHMSSVPPALPLLKRRAVLFGAVGVIVVVAILAVAMGSRSSTPGKRAVSAQANTKKAEPPAREIPAAVAAPAPTPVQAPQATAEAVASSVAVASAAPTEAADEEAKITISVKPDGSSLFYKGKVVGKTPFILKQPRGEKRSYEIGKPGYATRRLVINGNERTIGFELGIDTPHPDSL